MKNIILFLTIPIFFMSCKKEKVENKTIKTFLSVDSNIKKDTAFILLNSLPESYNFLDPFVPNSKKTSNVHFNYGKDIEATEHYFSVQNNVEAIKKNDSLIISISQANGYTGFHLNLIIIDNTLVSDYGEFTDMLSYDDKKPQNKTLNQNLILDKSNYNLNDSIYGFVNFKSQYIDRRGDTLYVNAKGHFRTKVKKANFN